MTKCECQAAACLLNVIPPPIYSPDNIRRSGPEPYRAFTGPGLLVCRGSRGQAKGVVACVAQGRRQVRWAPAAVHCRLCGFQVSATGLRLAAACDEWHPEAGGEWFRERARHAHGWGVASRHGPWPRPAPVASVQRSALDHHIALTCCNNKCQSDFL